MDNIDKRYIKDTTYISQNVDLYRYYMPILWEVLLSRYSKNSLFT